ncbi:MAG: hypothetical protein K0R59_561 [Sphingobacterium sp.]|jgi:hypothetical protein|nr:hypothetical protein [Sphingobacterium sp.]
MKENGILNVTGLRNILLVCGLIVFLGYMFLVVPSAFKDWSERGAATFLLILVYTVARYAFLPWALQWSGYRAWLFGLLLIVFIVLFVLLIILFSICTGALEWKPHEWNIENFWQVTLLLLPGLMIACFMYGWHAGVAHWHSYQSMKKIAQDFEMTTIMKELNPHFVANSMATIRALVRRSPKEALSAIAVLGEISAAYLHTGEHHWITLRMEIELAKNLIKMYEWMKNDPVHFLFTHDLDTENSWVPKMLIFNLIENALQYGLTDDATRPIVLRVAGTDGNRISIDVSNSIASAPMADMVSHGTGLERLRRQLLLLDPSAKFNVVNDGTSFQVDAVFLRYEEKLLS